MQTRALARLGAVHQVAPLCFECAEAYGQALRFLTNSDEHNLYLRSVTWLFWTK